MTEKTTTNNLFELPSGTYEVTFRRNALDSNPEPLIYRANWDAEKRTVTSVHPGEEEEFIVDFPEDETYGWGPDYVKSLVPMVGYWYIYAIH